MVALGGTLGLDALGGGFSLSRARGRWGVSREREGEWQSGARRRRRVRVRVARRRVRDETREGSSGWGAAGGEGGVAFHLADGVLRERGSDGDRNSDGEGDRTGRGPAATASAAGDGIGGFCDTDSNDDRDGEDRDSDDGDSRGSRFECGDVGRDSTERFEGAVGDEVRDRGQQQRQGRRQQLQRRGRQRQHQRRPGTATTARTGQQRQRRRQRGAMASCVEGTSRATSERDRTADSNAGWPHRVVRRRFDVDETRTVFGTVREEGAWPGGGHAVGDTSRASKCLGALELQRERVGWVGRAGDTPPGCRRRTVQGGECGKEHITVSSGLELHD